MAGGSSFSYAYQKARPQMIPQINCRMNEQPRAFIMYRLGGLQSKGNIRGGARHEPLPHWRIWMHNGGR